jgi:hypothetical protein
MWRGRPASRIGDFRTAAELEFSAVPFLFLRYCFPIAYKEIKNNRIKIFNSFPVASSRSL